MSFLQRLRAERACGVWPLVIGAASMFSLTVTALFGGSDALRHLFFDRGGDLFMDYFNSVRDAAQGLGAYTERRVIYPPMANFIFLLFSYLVPTPYRATAFTARHTWRLYPAAWLSLFLFLAIPLAALLVLCYRQGARQKRGLAALAALFNFPLFYLLERGNILLFALVAVLFFFFYEQDARPVYRELALVSLAFAISLKLYPALLALPLLSKERYREALRLALYSLSLLILPSFFFGGPRCLWLMLQNILSFTEGAHTPWGDLFGFLPAPWPTLLDYLPFLILLCLFLRAVLIRSHTVSVLGICALFAFPALQLPYAWSLFLGPLFLPQKLPQKNKRGYLAALLTPFPIYPFATAALYRVLTALSLLALLSLFFIDVLRSRRA